MFEFRYFHGTSKIFLDSIIEFGLGGINPNFKYKNLELLCFLTNEAESKLLKDETYLSLRKVVIAMSKQSLFDYNLPNGQTFKTNYKHDGIYVGITKGRALTYACLNRYGSEILIEIINVNDLETENGENGSEYLSSLRQMMLTLNKGN